jgi:uncharacterized protein YheU (UPF0270 family)
MASFRQPLEDQRVEMRFAWRSIRTIVASRGRGWPGQGVYSAGPARVQKPSGMGGVEQELPASVVVPYTELAADLLHAVVESYVLREGTDYGEKEVSLEAKVSQVIGQLKRGDAKIVFDPETESVSVVRT